MKKLTVILGVLGVVAITNDASAVVIGGDVTSGTGTFKELTVPLLGSTPYNTVGNNNFQNTNLYAFDEDQNVPVGVGGLVPELGGPLAEGLTVASHYVFFDPGSPAEWQTGYVLFDAPILGVFTSTTSLGLSDYLANTGVNYEDPTLRGLENGDIVSFTGNRLDVHWYAGNPGDYVRVLTARSQGTPNSIPDAGATAILMGLGCLALGAVSRRRK